MSVSLLMQEKYFNTKINKKTRYKPGLLFIIRYFFLINYFISTILFTSWKLPDFSL
jgi:hypothetical protein